MHLDDLREMLRICPSDLAARCALADLLEGQGAFDDALVQWKTALGYDPNSLRVWEGIARCRERLAGTPDRSRPV